MRKSDGFKLDILSQIADDIIERNSVKRAYLLNKRKKKRNYAPLIVAGALAASILLVLGGMLLGGLFGSEPPPTAVQQIPVYEGMTVSDTLADAGGEALALQAPASLMARSGVARDAAIKARADHYARPGSTVYITVHLSNPDEYEIVSLRQNGKKYTSYMFERGSDLENLILKVELGMEEGIFDYTVDSIKYIDGKKIDEADKQKELDVLMRGNPTVSIGVYAEESFPSVHSPTVTAGFDTLALTLRLRDPHGLIAASKGNAYVALYNADGQLVATKPVAVGVNELLFTGLPVDATYRYTVEAVCDMMNGMPAGRHVLVEGEVRTRSPLTLVLAGINDTGVSFSAEWAADFDAPALDSLTLLLDGVQVKTLSADTTSLSGLLPQRNYTLVAAYTWKGIENKVTLSFTTGRLYCTVTHYQETLDGEWVEVYSERVEVFIGQTLSPATRQYLGFVVPTRESVVGNTDLTEINYYYARKRSTATFVTNGGEPIASGTYMYGEKLPTPVRDGYAFKGWTTSASGTNVVTEMGASNQTYYAHWSGPPEDSRFVYEIVDGEAMITGHRLPSDGVDMDLVIPSNLGGYPVTKIAKRAFANSQIKGLTLGKNVKVVCEEAFEGCERLVRISMNSDVLIQNRAFLNCTALLEIDFGSGEVTLEALSGGIFSGAMYSVVLPENVTLTGSGIIFALCTNLVEIYNLTSCELKDKPLVVHTSADAPSAIKITPDGWLFVEVDGEGVLIEYTLETDYIDELILPSSTPSGYTYVVSDRVFRWFPAVTRLIIPDGVTEIWSLPESIRYLEIGGDVKYIAAETLSLCYELVQVVFADPDGWWVVDTEYIPETVTEWRVDVSDPWTTAENFRRFTPYYCLEKRE